MSTVYVVTTEDLSTLESTSPAILLIHFTSVPLIYKTIHGV